MQDEKQKVRAFFAKYIRATDLADDADIFALGFGNSLFAMQLVLFVEREFGCQIESEDLSLDNFRSVQAIVDLVGRKLKPAGA